MIVRFTIIDQRLLLHLTASSPDPHPTRPALRHIILAVVCWRLLGITAVGMESGKPGGYLQGDKCGEGKPKQGRVATVYCAYWFLGHVLRWISSI